MLVHELHREYNNNSPGDQFDYLVKGTLVLHALTHRAMIDFIIQQSKSSNDLNCSDLMEERLHFNHMWTNPFLVSLGENHAPLSCNPSKSVSSFV